MAGATVPRPGPHDEDVERRHMAMIRDDVAKYLKDANTGDDLITAMDDVRKAMKFETDGYRIAEYLDGRGWSADAELVELMDRLSRRPLRRGDRGCRGVGEGPRHYARSRRWRSGRHHP